VVAWKSEQLPFLGNAKIGVGVGGASIVLAILRVADLEVHAMTLPDRHSLVNSDLQLLTFPP
jgi:hypothetical protein